MGKRPKPLYTESDMYNMFDKMRYADGGKIHKLDDWVSYQLYEAGHVLGSKQIKLYFRLPNNRVETLVYTGDLGSNYNLQFKPFIKPKDIIPSANYYIFEATYSDPERSFTKKQSVEERKELKKLITKTIKNNKRVFLPSFAFGRTQELMVLFYDFFKDEEWFKDIPITVDGQLTNTICNTYSKVLKDEDLEKWETVKNWKNFVYNKTYDGTKMLLSERKTGIYISSSGFIQPKTRSCDYVKHFLGREGDLIVFVGFYGGVGSIGDRLVNTPKGDAIKIDNTSLIKSCNVVSLKTFSSHIQRQELFDYWKQITADKIIIHHCDEEFKEQLIKDGTEELRKINKTTKIVAVNKKNDQFIL
jgi:metallo-beta-lactamase family protein